MHYIKWNEAQTSYEIWHGPSIGVAAMTAMGYVRVETLPVVTPETPPLDSLVFSKYQVAKKLMELGAPDVISNASKLHSSTNASINCSGAPIRL